MSSRPSRNKQSMYGLRENPKPKTYPDFLFPHSSNYISIKRLEKDEQRELDILVQNKNLHSVLQNVLAMKTC